MPHLIVDYSRNIHNLAQEKLLKHLNQALITTGLFKAADIKSRIHKSDVFVIGDNDESQAYIHSRLFILEGRTNEERALLSQTLLTALKNFKGYEAYTLNLQLCAELLEMPVANYAKAEVQM
ncbi:5-carboxymethyl-2-hydroxymuconate Delta-isomerase [Acinetobacter sp. MD2]|uniref:5-carboxymethyl-2-hydroxymuconate Delta-isomerase n=1 Tax=Acinetobacter sp. MD2 TaxID=2600066 RepID=UPI002D1EFCCF|nr:5-carboxymethyl-2-hydroxymuconate Delta-isomerase [Acinetobacter sp. MD2]MEB3767827.1 5-carboxymethyl-2-hydroxymuconate Delta-isomerase [Acinetobacter sp. MD2]